MTLIDILGNLEWHRKLKIIRTAKGWTQIEAAKRCGTNQKIYWLWEQGKVSPRNNSRKAIARAFNLSVNEIFGKETA